jgi:hypothetical protein
VKSWTTKVSVGNSKGELEELLRRYGATGFTVSEDYASRTVVVMFFLRPRPDDEAMEVRLPISYRQVLDRLRRMPDFVNKAKGKGREREQWEMDQSERVAWRHVILWADAILSSVDAGLFSLPQAFFAHAMIDTPTGARVRAVDAVTAMKLLPASP